MIVWCILGTWFLAIAILLAVLEIKAQRQMKEAQEDR